MGRNMPHHGPFDYGLKTQTDTPPNSMFALSSSHISSRWAKCARKFMTLIKAVACAGALPVGRIPR